MKKSILLIATTLVAISTIACPRPTSHAVVKVGATYDYSFIEKINSVDNIGVGGSIGWESAQRWSTISIDGAYIVGSKVWRVGGEYAFAPLSAIDSPVSPKITISSGYKSTKVAYLSMGVEIDFGSNISWISPYISAKFGFESITTSFKPMWGTTAEVGIRFWLGNSW